MAYPSEAFPVVVECSVEHCSATVEVAREDAVQTSAADNDAPSALAVEEVAFMQGWQFEDVAFVQGRQFENDKRGYYGKAFCPEHADLAVH